MKIDSKKLYTFVKKTTLNGAIETCVIRGSNEGLKINVRNGNAIAVYGLLKDVKDEITLPIKSSTILLNILNAFNDKITIEVKGNMLKIFNEFREAEIVLSSEEFIENELKEKVPFEYSGDVSVQSSILKQALKNKEIIKGDTLVVEVKNNVLSILTGKVNFDKMIEKTKVDYADCTNELGAISFDVINVLEGLVKLSMKTDYPIKIVESDEEKNIQYFIAPLEVNKDEK